MVRLRSEGAVKLPGAKRFRLQTGDDGDWELSVFLPSDELRDSRTLMPTLYVLDASHTFVVTAQVVSTLLSFSLGQLQPFAVVGLDRCANNAAEFAARRVRDLTPTVFVPPHFEGKSSFGTGGGEATLDLIEEVVAPRLEQRLPLDPGQRGLAGISLGGLLACWSAVTRPGSFTRYMAVSPSLWWDDHLLLDDVRAGALPGAGADSHVYLAAGEMEDDPARSWPRVPDELIEQFRDLKLVTDTRRFADKLRVLGWNRVTFDVIAGASHATVWPAAMLRGVIALYGTSPV